MSALNFALGRFSTFFLDFQNPSADGYSAVRTKVSSYKKKKENKCGGYRQTVVLSVALDSHGRGFEPRTGRDGLRGAP